MLDNTAHLIGFLDVGSGDKVTCSCDSKLPISSIIQMTTPKNCKFIFEELTSYAIFQSDLLN